MNQKRLGLEFESIDSGECKDIDECKLGTDTCGANELCVNHRSGFHCNPLPPVTTIMPQMEGCTASKIEYCDQYCTRDHPNSGFSCKCLEDESGQGQCHECYTGRINWYCFKALLINEF